MRVVSLVGQSGSGKSYKAIMLAKDLDIEYIIDDGLLIQGNKMIAGKSAKGESTTISAVKRAVFTDYNHRKEVKDVLRTLSPNGILILGTSDKMIERITESLDLPKVKERIYIQEISSEEEIRIASEERKRQGKHVIPVPTFEVKKDFSGYFIDTLKILRKRDSIKEHVYEKTVVRPTFSYLGKYTISDSVIKDIIKYVTRKIDGLYKVSSIYTRNYKEGLFINIEISVIYGYSLVDTVRYMQKRIASEIENMTSLNMLRINVTVKKLIVK